MPPVAVFPLPRRPPFRPQERRLTRTGALIDPDRDLTFDSLLGVGGEGAVYRGTWMSMPVAIKMLHDNRRMEAGDAMSNFRREARAPSAAAAAPHPALIP